MANIKLHSEESKVKPGSILELSPDMQSELFEDMSTEQINDKFDKIMEARDDLFDSHIKKGLNKHEKFMDSIKQ